MTPPTSHRGRCQKAAVLATSFTLEDTGALMDLLNLVECKFAWALEDDEDSIGCTGEDLCAACREEGCIRMKIDAGRVAVAKAQNIAGLRIVAAIPRRTT